MAPTNPKESSRVLWRLSGRQHGVVTRGQLLEHDLSSEAIRHRLIDGRLHALARGVYAVGRPEVSRQGRWLAATLGCGAGAVLSHASAAELWGLRDSRAVTVDVTVPYGRDPRHPGVAVRHASLTADDVTERTRVPVVVVARVMLNQAAVLTPRQLERDVNVADARGLITPERLREMLPRFAGQPGVTALRDLLERHTLTLTDSELERMFLPLARRAGLPEPFTRYRVNGFRVDFFWPSLGLVVETDGLRYHRTPAQQARDLVREQTHRGAGLEPLRFTHRQVVSGQDWVELTLRRVAARLAGPRTNIPHS